MPEKTSWLIRNFAPRLRHRVGDKGRNPEFPKTCRLEPVEVASEGGYRYNALFRVD